MVKVSFVLSVTTTAPIQFRQSIRALFGSSGVHVSDHVGVSEQ